MHHICFSLILILITQSAFSQNFYNSEQELKNYIINANYASLAFAAEDFKSPISSFGHIFVIFHNSNVEPEAQSIVVEFVGDLRADNLLIKSLFHEIPGAYNLSTFFHKKREYELENRSLLIAPLILNPQEFKKLKTLSISYSNQKFGYNFLFKNCSKYIYDLILESSNSTCTSLAFNNPYNNYQSLSSCNTITHNYTYPSTAVEFLTAIESKKNNNSEMSQNKLINFQILREKHEFKRDKLLQKKVQLLSNNNTSQNTDLLKTTIKHKSLSRAYIKNNLNLKGANYIGVTPAHLFFSNNFEKRFWSDTLKIFETEVLVRNDDLKLSRLNILDIRSRQESNQIHSGFTKNINLFYQYYDLNNNRHLKVHSLNYGFGKTWALLNRLKFSALINFDFSYYDKYKNSNAYLTVPLQFEVNLRLSTKNKLRFFYKNSFSNNNYISEHFSFQFVVLKVKNFSLNYMHEIINPANLDQQLLQLDYLF